MKRTLFVGILCTVILGLISLSGCKKAGEFLTDEEVIKELEKESGTEKIIILNKQEDNGRIRYSMKTDQRGIEFEELSHAAGEDPFYNPANVGRYEYVKAVQALYKDEVDAIKEELQGKESYVIFKDRSELRVVCEKLEQMDQIYRQELVYHDAKWLETFPITVVNLSRRDDPENKGDFSYGVKVDGTINAADLEQYICDLYMERTGKELQ